MVLKNENYFTDIKKVKLVGLTIIFCHSKHLKI